MRTIKYRGKQNDTWLYGYVFEKAGEYFIFDDKGQHEVNQESIGQFTGIKDTNEKLVYEGDIILIPPTNFNVEIIGVVVFYNASFIVRSLSSGSNFSIDYVFRERMPGKPNPQIIGNIFESKELIEKFISYDEVKDWRSSCISSLGQRTH